MQLNIGVARVQVGQRMGCAQSARPDGMKLRHACRSVVCHEKRRIGEGGSRTCLTEDEIDAGC